MGLWSQKDTKAEKYKARDPLHNDVSYINHRIAPYKHRVVSGKLHLACLVYLCG